MYISFLVGVRKFEEILKFHIYLMKSLQCQKVRILDRTYNNNSGQKIEKYCSLLKDHFNVLLSLPSFICWI